MPIDLNELKRQSKIAAVLTFVASLVVLASLLFGYLQINRAERNLAKLDSDRKNLEEVNTNLEKVNSDLKKKRDALTQEINTFISTNTNQPTQRPGPTVSGHPVSISIDIAETRDRAEAEKAAEVLRSKGYAVTAIDVKRLGEATHDTTIRFFQYDRNTVAIGKDLVELLRGIGFKVRPEFDAEFVGTAHPPSPGTYEFWIGINPSYTPSRGMHP